MKLIVLRVPAHLESRKQPSERPLSFIVAWSGTTAFSPCLELAFCAPAPACISALFHAKSAQVFDC